MNAERVMREQGEQGERRSGEGIRNRFAAPDEVARFEVFSDWLRRRGRRAATLRSYRADWQGLSGWYRRARRRPYDSRRLEPGDAAAWRDDALERGQSGATVARRMAFLARYVGWLGQRGVLPAPLVEAVRRTEKVPQAATAPRVLADEAVNHLLQVVERRGCIRDQAIFHVLLGSGVKAGEMVRINVGDVDFAQGILWIGGVRSREVPMPTRAARKLAWSLVERGLLEVPQGELVLPASGGWPPAGRVPPPPPEALPRLRRLPRSPMPADPLGEPVAWPLFAGEKGRLSPSGIQRVVRKYGAFARLEVTPQVLRHTFAFAYLVGGGDLVTLAERLGHQNIETTRIYERAQPAPLDSRAPDYYP